MTETKARAGGRKKRGPKTPEGRLAIRLNASTHGILSVQPVVGTYEKAEDWETHRTAVVDSLAPEGGMEQVLAERVALCSWRLNRVALYESERASEIQEAVVEYVRERRKRKLEIERLLAKPGEAVLTDIGILIEAHPANAPEDLVMARALYKAVEMLCEASPAAQVKGAAAAAVLERVASRAVELAAYQAGDETRAEEGRWELSESLQERLPGIPDGAFLEDLEYTVGRLRELVGWLAVEAGMEPDANTVDGSAIGPQEALMEALYRKARYELAEKESKAEKVQEELLAARRDRILPDEGDLQKIARYEAHLSRQMYQALHELEALQKRRSGAEPPLARVDVQGP
jgi:hypothetical protein